MSVTGKSFGSLHPESPKVERLAETKLPRDRQLDLYRLLRLTRMVEGRLGNLYRQGKVVGGLYTSLAKRRPRSVLPTRSMTAISSGR